MSRAAVAVFDNTQVKGEVLIKQKGSGVQIKALFSRLPGGKHGFHIHRAGDLRGEGCKGACDHWHKGEPGNVEHGDSPSAPGANQTDPRHTGDLGNIEERERKTIFLDNVSLDELYGRAMIIHADEDDLGKGGHEDSKTTGHSGARIGCAIIGRIESASQKIIKGGSCHSCTVIQQPMGYKPIFGGACPCMLQQAAKGDLLVSNLSSTKSGGFIPSVRVAFTQNAAMLTPLAFAAGYRLVENSKKNHSRKANVRKNRGKTRSKANLRRRR